MNRQHKVEIVESLHHDFTNSKASFVIGYQGLTVAQMQVLRAELRKHGGKLKVAKARLIKRAAHDLKCQEQLNPYFRQQIGLVFVENQAPAVAKVLQEFSKNNEALRLIGGCVDDMVLDATSLIRIASLPSREVLLAQVCGVLQSSVARPVRVLNMALIQLVWTLKQASEKK